MEQKQRLLTSQPGQLSEIGEEPINILSTEQGVSPSVEPEISRISSSHNISDLNYLQLTKRDSSEQNTKHEREDEVEALECSEQLQFDQDLA